MSPGIGPPSRCCRRLLCARRHPRGVAPAPWVRSPSPWLVVCPACAVVGGDAEMVSLRAVRPHGGCGEPTHLSHHAQDRKSHSRPQPRSQHDPGTVLGVACCVETCVMKYKTCVCMAAAADCTARKIWLKPNGLRLTEGKPLDLPLVAQNIAAPLRPLCCTAFVLGTHRQQVRSSHHWCGHFILVKSLLHSIQTGADCQAEFETEKGVLFWWVRAEPLSRPFKDHPQRTR